MYDKLGRPISRKDADGNTTWQWDTQEHGIGKLHTTEYIPDFGPVTLVTESFVYDALGQINQISQSVNGDPLIFNYTYDIFGRMKKQTWPSVFSVTNYYDENGYLRSIAGVNGEKLWEAVETDQWNKVNKFKLGSKIMVQKELDPLTGLITMASANTMSADKAILQNMVYEWSVTGNLTKRDDIRRELKEEFGYDSFNRLKTIKLNNGNINETAKYNNIGNITDKLDAGNYYYSIPMRPYAVGKITPVTGPFPAYEQIISYTKFNKVKDIVEGDHTLEIGYGPQHERVWQRQTTLSTGAQKIKRYFTSQFEIVADEKEQKQYVHYLVAPSGVFGIFTSGDNQADKIQYVINDHQGSIAELVDANGNISESYSFDAWGRRRSPSDWSYNDIPPYTIDRGYTFHEHLDAFGLINMNGRMYDPLVGRMLSPDPFIQMPGYSQSYNRFTYAFNNPLRFSDPSGYFAGGDSIRQNNNPLINKLFPKKEKYTIKQSVSYFNTDNISLGPISKGIESNELLPVVDSKVGNDAEGNAASQRRTFEQARLWYQFGGGTRMDVELNSIDFSRVSMSDMKGKLIEVNLDNPFKHYTNMNDALVYGTLYLYQEKGNVFRAAHISEIKGRGDYYNFDVKWTSPEAWLFRNENTIVGGLINGLMPMGGFFIYVGGTPYPIFLHGTVTIEN